MDRRAHMTIAVGFALALIAGAATAEPPNGKPARRAAALAERLGLGTKAAANALFRGQPEARWVNAAGGGRDKLPGTLRWPVAKGWFVRGFGSSSDGHHLAIDIGGKTGANVRAAADGIVGYAGDGVSGFGNLVILVHSGGMLTFYGHNSKLAVVAGQRVRRGDVIAEVGSTGISRGPHVHFEMAYGGELCDPLPLFRPGVRRHDGRPMPIEKAVWRWPSKRPSAVTCRGRRPYTGEASPAHDADPDADAGADQATEAKP
jgi:murein DD-endopeptidase MepM/ murein hydrolase activator NlpD